MSLDCSTSAILAYLLLGAASDASMRDRTISGDILDARVVACGIRIGDSVRVELEPLLEARQRMFPANSTSR